MNAWVRSVPFLPGESLYSWMVRAALAQGCDPLVMTGSIWPRWRIWTLDFDRGIDADKLRLLVKASGIASGSFEERFLREEAEKISGHTLPDAGTWPWILTLGSRNRKRSAGMQYCPVCFATAEPYLKRAWRLAWHTVCADHQVILVDRCWSCNALVSPHRLVAGCNNIAKCFNCAADLRCAEPFHGSRLAHDFQCRSDAVLASSQGKFDGRDWSAHHWFNLARFFVGLTRYALRSETCGAFLALRELGLLTTPHQMPVYSVSLELMSPGQRVALFEKVSQLMSMPSADLARAFKAAGMSVNSLCAISAELPHPIQGLFNELSRRDHHTHRKGVASMKPKSKRTVDVMWKRLLRKMGMRPDE